jgi:hypothetical protein
MIRTLITTDKRQNRAEALQSLAEIAAEYDTPVAVIAIGGWPAVERKRLAPLEFPGEPKIGESAPQALRLTTAIAADDLVIRFESFLAPNANPDLADHSLAIARSAVFSLVGKDPRLEQNVTLLREQMIPAMRRASPQRSLSLEPHTVARAAPSSAAAPGAAVQIPNALQGELEIAASTDGQIVIANNNGFSSSQDGGFTFPSMGGIPATFQTQGDPSLAVGRSGNFYFTFIGRPAGEAAANGVNGCTTGISVSTNNRGTAFAFRNFATICQLNGPNFCFPDQEHIAADRANTAPGGGDQVYSVWRNFAPQTAPAMTATCNNFGGTPTPAIVCSRDIGATWTVNPQAFDTGGDFPRIAVGSDGFVYAVSLNGGKATLTKFSSCANGLVNQFSTTIFNNVNVPCPIDGLDRCNNGNTLVSPTVAVDDTDPNHIYVAVAARPAGTTATENIVVADSTDGGRRFGRMVQLNASIGARRFMPWLSVTRGIAYVTWYDRRTATANANDLTSFYLGSAFVDSGPFGDILQAGTEQNLTANADPQCGRPSAFPCGVRNIGDFNTCPAFSMPNPPPPPQVSETGGCPKYGDYNGSAAISGRVYAAWASATAPQLPNPNGIRVFFTKAVDPFPADFFEPLKPLSW